MMDLSAIVKNIQKRIRKTGQKDLPNEIVGQPSATSMSQRIFSSAISFSMKIEDI